MRGLLERRDRVGKVHRSGIVTGKRQKLLAKPSVCLEHIAPAAGSKTSIAPSDLIGRHQFWCRPIRSDESDVWFKPKDAGARGQDVLLVAISFCPFRVIIPVMGRVASYFPTLSGSHAVRAETVDSRRGDKSAYRRLPFRPA